MYKVRCTDCGDYFRYKKKSHRFVRLCCNKCLGYIKSSRVFTTPIENRSNMLILGIIIGLLIALIILSTTIYLKLDKRVVDKIVSKTQSIKKEKGSIYIPLSGVEQAQEDKMKENDKKGLDTNLEDLI